MKIQKYVALYTSKIKIIIKADLVIFLRKTPVQKVIQKILCLQKEQLGDSLITLLSQCWSIIEHFIGNLYYREEEYLMIV